jgi:hypothetical protein
MYICNFLKISQSKQSTIHENHPIWSPLLDCQMVSFQTKNPFYLGGLWNGKML